MEEGLSTTKISNEAGITKSRLIKNRLCFFSFSTIPGKKKGMASKHIQIMAEEEGKINSM